MSSQEPATDESNWVDAAIAEMSPVQQTPAKSKKKKTLKTGNTLVLVETAFLASTSSLIWLIDYYFPMGPLLKIFFPIPIALVYLRWGRRASVMGALVSGLLLSVLMGPTRSVVFLMPYGLMGIQLGLCWRRGGNWNWSMLLGTVIGTFGIFFRLWLFSILLGDDLWLYAINQITGLANWSFLQLGILAQPSFLVIEILAVLMIVLNNLFYLFAVHLVALFVFDKLGNPIPRPPGWVQVILDYD
jgi:uncharacterized protein YybS (DUF2232 family)